ncbi:MAG: DUF1559 family PulG-like putative transporter, partial [Planctomycetota bacterium]|jgi:hypothetical protein
VLRGALRRIAERAALSNLRRPLRITGRILTRVLLLGVVVAFLFLLVVPAHGGRERARRTRCASNLKQIGYGCHLYSGDFDEQFPADLSALYPDYVSDTKVFVCPSGFGGKGAYIDPPADRFSEEHVSYCYVSGLTAEDKAYYILAFDEERNHEGIGVNVLYVAGSIQWHRLKSFRAELEKQLAEFEANGRTLRVIRPPWSRYPDRPGRELRMLWKREPATAALLLSAGLLLALDAGLFVVWLVARRRRKAAGRQ